MRKLEYISEAEEKSLTTATASAPRMYGLIKIHKHDYPLRPIVSPVEGPTKKLSKFLQGRLRELHNEKYYIKDSFAFADIIAGMTIPEGHILVSLDVVALFTNIPLDLTLQAIEKRWHTIEGRTRIPRNGFTELMAFCYNSGYFMANGAYYKQERGIAMGSCLSPTVATLVMDTLLDEVLPTLGFSCPLIKKYVDDLFLIIPENRSDRLLKVFNKYNSNIQFTLDVEKDRTLAFLDTLVIRNMDGSLSTKWYRKPTSSARYINYSSQHPKHMLINVATNLKNRAARLSSEDHRQGALKMVKEILLQNTYPRSLVNKIIHNASVTRRDRNFSASSSAGTLENNSYFSFPFVEGLTLNVEKVFREKGFHKIAYKPQKTIGRLFSTLKDPLPVELQSNVVYRLDCKDCGCPYLGQTKRQLKVRISEHKRQSEKTSSILTKGICALTSHAIAEKHEFDFERPKVLHREPVLAKRLIKEMLYIHDEPRAVNFKKDIENFSKIYGRVLELNNNLKRKPPWRH